METFNPSSQARAGPAEEVEKYHGKNGPLRVEDQRVSWELLDYWREAAQEYGIPKIENFNRGNNFGSSYFQVN